MKLFMLFTVWLGPFFIGNFCFGSAPLRIALDAGHGGKDRGAVRGPAVESVIVEGIAKELFSLLRQAPGIDARLLRAPSESQTLIDRRLIAEQFRADLLISLHANASVDRRAKGFEVYLQNPVDVDEVSQFILHRELEQKGLREKNEKLSDLELIVEDLKRGDRQKRSLQFAKTLWQEWSLSRKSVRQASFYLVSSPAMPSVLVEVGYLSNPDEQKRLLDPHFQKLIARELMSGIKKFQEHLDNPPGSSLD